MNYWKECVSSALDEANLSASDEQISTIAKVVEGGHEMFGMAHGHECIPNPLVEENEKLSRSLKVEREKIACQACHGRGVITEYFGFRSSTYRCDKCNGEGKHSP